MTINVNSRLAPLTATDPSSSVTSRRPVQPERDPAAHQDNASLGEIITAIAATTDVSAERIEALKMQFQGGTYHVDAQQLAARILA